jgi:hypothetical protein
MKKSLRSKTLSILLTLTMIVSLLAGMTISASATSYTVTFSATNATVQIKGVTVTSTDMDDSETLTFNIIPSMGYTIGNNAVTASTGTITKEKTNSYTLSNITGATTVTITASSFDATGSYWTDLGVYDTSWYTGGGPYTISDADDLAGVAYLVNSGTTDFEGKTINLGGNIDLAGHYWYPIGGVSPSPAASPRDIISRDL